MKRNLAALAVTLALGLTFACSSGDGPTAPNTDPGTSGTANVPGANTNPTPTPPAPAGVTVTELESTFNPDRCTDLTLPQYRGLTQLVHKARIVNNSGGGIYSKPAIFHSPKATCGATGDNPGNADGFVSGDKTLDNGKSGTVVYTFPITGDMCGDYQLDDTWRGQVNTFVIGKVISTGKDCPSCEGTNFKSNLAKTSKRSFTVAPTFKGGGTVDVAWGDGGVDRGVRSGQSVSHTYGDAGKTYRITYTLNSQGIQCVNEDSASTDPDPTPSPTPTPSPSPTPSPDPCAGVGSPTFSMTKSEAATTGTVTSTLTFPSGFSGSITLAPSPVSGFSGGSVTSGNPNNSLYNRPESNQSPLTVNGSWQVRKGEQSCKSGSGSVTITPKPREPTCADFPPPVITLTPNVTTTSTQVTVNSITANPSGGTFNPNPPQTYERPAYGSPAQTKTFTYTLQYSPAQGLTCTARKDTSVQVPPREPTCEQQNPPRFGNPNVSNSGGTLTITQQVFNSGSWTGTLYAGTPGNPHQFNKNEDTDQVVCGGNDTLSVSYYHQNHSACYWTYELKRNGTLQSGYPIVVLNRCQ